jgi:signal transduction histidine kinase
MSTLFRNAPPSKANDHDPECCQRRLRTLTFEISVAEERERERIATGLHDELGQLLASAKITLGLLGELVQDEPARSRVQDLRKMVAKATSATRSTTFELSPRFLHKIGLESSIERWGARIERLHGLRVRVVKAGEPLPLCGEMLALLFRVVRELLLNVQKHAQATTATVSLRRSDQQAVILVEDDGVGFDLIRRSEASGLGPGFGLDSLYVQLESIGGALVPDSSPGRGTRMLVRAPLRVRVSERA